MVIRMKMYQCLLSIITGFAIGLFVSGCTALVSNNEMPTTQLSEKDEVMLGDAVMPIMLQMLGGRYHDELIQQSVKRIGVDFGRRGPRPSLICQSGLIDSAVCGRWRG